VSIAAMNWAWRQRLSPTPKLVLMALADAADDHGVCWPSVATLSGKCTVSPRTVQRVLRMLVEQQLLVAEARHRQNGACSSNRYRLAVKGGDNLSPPDTDVTTPCQPCQGPPDNGVTPGTTIGTLNESPQPPALPMLSPEVGTEGCSDSDFELDYPNGLSPSERIAAQKQLAHVPVDTAQQLLDELAARLAADAVRTSSIAYLRGLIKRARSGTFTPEGALKIADARERRRQIDTARTAADQEYAVSATINENDPLVRRLRAIQEKARTRSKN